MKQECNQNGLIDPNDPKEQLIQFCNAIFFDRKFYALSLQGTLAIIEEINESQFQVTRLSRKRAIPSNYSKHFIEYFLESNGEILLIFLISEGSNSMVDKVEVFKLQIGDLSWLKLDNLGDRTLFTGINCCMSVLASQVGCRNNCVYFTHHSIDG
ncbi:putative F-box protein At3g25750 [Solanum dulcamara]|uniref:putative F-box protein At3g25750 n=1 Tax=Solanum dulcamara TaxID=45834 RepID=UPI002485666E|nr:putative F-box protein At3g25750 [Solanum dulcamara]XP_055816019.1 putative F-box protein At3g25750 [Solanum dulcamara]XP_055816020.1 putative F-box protein At3g25750 [Solanum dulcamara]